MLPRIDGLDPKLLDKLVAAGQLASAHGMKAFVCKGSKGIARIYSPA